MRESRFNDVLHRCAFHLHKARTGSFNDKGARAAIHEALDLIIDNGGVPDEWAVAYRPDLGEMWSETMLMPVELEQLTNRQGHVVLVGAPDGHVLRVTLAERAESNEFAGEVARRWNAHAALLAACEAVHDDPTQQVSADVLALVAAAIAQARGES